MSTSLREFLTQKAADYESKHKNNKQEIEEWQQAVDALFTQVEVWLAAADPEGIIEHKRSETKVSEPGLGQYPIHYLHLQAFGKWASLLPKARRTVKRAKPPQKGAPEQATGRVDITDELRRYVLYRFTRGTSDEWFIDDTAANTGLEPLTSARFETALMSYFQ